MGAEVLGHPFAHVAATAGVSVTLHQLRHAVATLPVSLPVSQGQVLAAQQRLGHADAAITLRVYCHALPGTDQAAADTIDAHLQPRDEPPAANPALGRPWRSTTNAPRTSEQGNVHAAPKHYAPYGGGESFGDADFAADFMRPG